MTVPTKEIEQRLNSFVDECHQQDIKVTHQRIEIFKEVAGTDEHPDAEAIYERVRTRMPTVSLDTVYRTLALLERLGLISRVRTPGERTRYDANMKPHHHYVCSMCGRIRDFYEPESMRIHIPAEVLNWGAVHSIHVELDGICKECAERIARTSRSATSPCSELSGGAGALLWDRELSHRF